MNPCLENMSIPISLIVSFPISASKDSSAGKTKKFKVTVFEPERVGYYVVSH